MVLKWSILGILTGLIVLIIILGLSNHSSADPDLAISPSDISFSEAFPIVNETVFIDAEIHNYGNESAYNVNVSFFLSDSTDSIEFINEGFEEGNINDWQTGGDANWSVSGTDSFDGIRSVWNNDLNDSQSSWISRTIVGPGKLSFYWRVSSEYGGDFLNFYINGVLKNDISGNITWDINHYDIPEGTHIIKWEYNKNISGSDGSDRGWIDEIVYIKGEYVGFSTIDIYAADKNIATYPWITPLNADNYSISVIIDSNNDKNEDYENNNVGRKDIIISATQPGTPENLNAQYSGDGVFLSWSPPLFDGGSPIINYKIYRVNNSGEVVELSSDGNVLTFVDNNTNKGKLSYRVAAENSIYKGLECDPVEIYVPYGFYLHGVREEISTPSKVKFVFSLRDGEGRPIPWAPELLANYTHIYEDDIEIDYTETAFFMDTAANIESEIILVLDFTNSMKEAGAIDAMVESAKALINQLADPIRIGIVEYHDRNIEPTRLQNLSTSKTVLISKIDGFINSGYESGSSRCWDAVYKGMQMFSSKKNTNAIKTLVFLSDGYDTSSSNTPNQIKVYASENGINIYSIGFGRVTPENEDVLRDISDSSGGFYYEASTESEILEGFQKISEDLRSYYVISYRTLQGANSGSVAVKFSIEFNSDYDYYETNLNLGSCFGDDRVGIISIEPLKPSITGGTTEFYIRAEHIPRNVKEFRFHLDTTYPVTVTLLSAEDGGLCERWSFVSESNNWWRVSSDQPIKFGSFGRLFRVEITGIGTTGIVIHLEFDNSIYPDIDSEGDGKQDKRMEHLEKIEIGTITQPKASRGFNAIPFIIIILIVVIVIFTFIIILKGKSEGEHNQSSKEKKNKKRSSARSSRQVQTIDQKNEEQVSEKRTQQKSVSPDIMNIWKKKYDSEGKLNILCPSCEELSDFFIMESSHNPKFVCSRCSTEYPFKNRV